MAEETEEERSSLTIAEMASIAKRRRWWIIIPALIGPIAGYILAITLPPLFTSKALVMMDQPRVLDAIMPATMSDQIAARLAAIQDLVLSRSNLESLIERLNLYPEERKSSEKSNDILIAGLKDSIKISLTRPDSNAGIRGFYIDVTMASPQMAQQVCKEILDKFMNESIAADTVRAEDTAEFLTTQLGNAKRKLDESSAKLLSFKTAHLGELPEDQQINLQELSDARMRLTEIQQEISQAQEQKLLQETTLAQLVATDKVASIGGESAVDLKHQLAIALNELSELETRYTPEHPDVIKKKTQIRSLQQQLASHDGVTNNSVSPSSAHMPDSPEASQLRASIERREETVRARRAEAARLQQESERIQRRVQMSSLVQEQYRPLTRDYEDALQAYNDLLGKRTQSAMIRDVQHRREGAQFHVMDAPSLPLIPSWPVKSRFTGIGLGIGLVLGAFLSMYVESKNKLLWTAQDIEIYLKYPIVAEVPDSKRA